MSDYLTDVQDDKVFYLGEKKIKNLYGLLFECRSITDEVYSYYADSEHNYFADWIEYVIKFKELSQKLRLTKSRKEAISVLEKEIDSCKGEAKAAVAKQQPAEIKISAMETKAQEKPLLQPEIKPQPAEKLLESKKDEMKILPPKEELHFITRVTDVEKEMHEKSKDKEEAKAYLWKHFSWEMAKEFMYGMALGILIGMVLSKIFFRV